jgi:pilus assembly protein CpaE
MYPLNAVLIGVEEKWLVPVRCELANCSVDVEAEFSSTAVATTALRKERSERRLLIYRIMSVQDIDMLSKLSTSLPGWPVLALFESHNEPGDSPTNAMFAFLRAGVSQFVSLPLRVADLKDALDRIAIQFNRGKARASIIAIAGVTGGCGATTIAINLADEIARSHGRRCILVDLSLRIGKIAAHLDVTAQFSILDLLRDVRRVDSLMVEKALVPVSERFSILAGPSDVTESRAVAPHDVGYLLNTLAQTADVVVVDVPCTYDDLYFETLAAAGQTVLVGEQTLLSIRSLALVHKALGGTGNSDGSDQIVVNRNDPRNSTFTVDRILNAIGVSSLCTVARDDAAVCAALNKGCPIRLVSPGSKALADVVALARTLLSPEAAPPANASLQGFFGQVRRAFSNTRG